MPEGRKEGKPLAVGKQRARRTPSQGEVVLIDAILVDVVLVGVVGLEGEPCFA